MSGRRLRMTGLAALALVALLAGCVSIPIGGGVTTTQVEVDQAENPLPTLPDLPTKDASPEQIITDFLRAGRGPQDNYRVARQYLTDDFRTSWLPGARTLISLTSISPIELADNTWSVPITATAAVDSAGRYQTAAPAESYDLTFGLVQDADGQWRINSAPDGTVLSPNRFSSIFKPYEVYFFDPTFAYLVPDLRWLRSGPTATTSVVDAMLGGPNDRLGDGALFSAFPEGTEREGTPTIDEGIATVPLTADVSPGGTTTHRRMEQQLLQTLRSVASVREVDITVNDFVLQVPDGGTQPEATYLVGNDPVGGVAGRVGVLSTDGVTALPGIGKAADAVGATGGSIVSHDRHAIALRGNAGVSIVRAGKDPVLIDSRRGLVAPSLDPLGFTWSVPAANPAGLIAVGPNGAPHAVPGLPADARVVSIDVARDGARLLVALSTAGGPRLVVFGIQRDADLIPTGLVTPLALPIGSSALRDAAWVDGVTVVVLSGTAVSSIDSYDIGGQHSSLGQLDPGVSGVSIVGGNGVEGTRVLDSDGNVLRPGGGTSWQDTGVDASFLASQQ